jgi:hypothetical protein
MDWEKFVRANDDGEGLSDTNVALIEKAISHYHKSIACLQKALDTEAASRSARSVRRSWNNPYGRAQ